MKLVLFLTASLISLFLMSLRTNLTFSSWINESSSYSTLLEDTITSKMQLKFKKEEIIITIQFAHKTDSASYNLDSYSENNTVFKVQIGKRKKDGFLYGYLDREKMQLWIMPTNFDLSLEKEIIDAEVTDSKWMVFDREK